jgi:putative phosphoribosyl transferase
MDGFTLFHDRKDAGQQLAKLLTAYENDPKGLLLALPRGGVPVAFEVAKQLHLPLDVFIVRKLGVPYQPELAMGAIANGDVTILNDDIIAALNISQDEINTVKSQEEKELRRREIQYRHDRTFPAINGKHIILIDDGIATGTTMQAAILALKKLSPAKIIVAVPVAARDNLSVLKRMADEVVCLYTPEPFYGVGMFYEIFSQTTDEEVCDLLNRK